MTQIDQIKRIGVIGLGRMGHGIAQAFAMGGFPVTGFDANDEARSSTLARIEANLREFVSNDLLSPQEAQSALARVSVAVSEEQAVADAQFVVEAIAEDLAIKREYFQRIEGLTEPSTILASNSSTFTISMSGNKLKHPERAIVTHWFNPPHIVPTVEVVPSDQTAEEVTNTTIELHKTIGKLAVRVNGEIPGFLVNRIQIAMMREVWDMYERGIASAEDIDAAVRGSVGFRLAVRGPLSIVDFGGVDIWSTVYQGLAPDLRADSQLPAVIQELVDDERFGTKVAQGIHDYEPERVDELTAQRDEMMLKLAKLMNSERGQD